MRVSHTEIIERPIAEVWAEFENAEAFTEWQTNLLEYSQVSGSYNAVGGVAAMKVRQVGMTNDLTVTVLSRDARKHRVAYRYEGAQAPFEIANSFRSVDGGTEWTAELDVKLNLLTKALAPVLKPIANELVKGNGRGFKSYCESR